MGLLRQLASKLPKNCLLPVVQGLIVSDVRYGLALFREIRTSDQDPTSSNMKQILVLINNVARFLTNKQLNDRT